MPLLAVTRSPPTPQQNHLLAALPPAVQDRLFPQLELAPVLAGDVLYETGGGWRHVYFPTDSVISLLYLMESGAPADISVVGNEGLVGTALLLVGERTPSRAIVLGAGHAWRLPGRQVKEEFDRRGELLLLTLRYTQFLITQMVQASLCNRHHSIAQQLCRLILLSLDRLPVAHRPLAGEPIARTFGEDGAAALAAASRLQELGAIELRRGQIVVVDRQRLEGLCCECYGVVRHETERLLPYSPRRETAAPGAGATAS